jgi:competence protein ComFC
MAIVEINPMVLSGPWSDGRVLDYHTISSKWTGDPYRYDTKRTELGERLYRFKYSGAGDLLTDIVDTAEMFIRDWNPTVECVVPAPPSLNRTSQPVVEITKELAIRLGLASYLDALTKVETTTQMKNVQEVAEREKLLEKAIQAGTADVRGKSILLVDDLIDSGATLRRAARVLRDAGALSIYALVLTRTRRQQ